MTAPNGKHEFEAATEYLSMIRDHYGTHPTITFPWRGGEQQRQIEAAISALQDYPKVKAEAKGLGEMLSTALAERNELMSEIEKAEAELARYRRFDPLIEAASVAEITRDVWAEMLIRAALKCREEKP